jgi:hypothetical protein
MKKNLIFTTVLIFILAILYILSKEEIVAIPSDSAHSGITNEINCLDCHASGKANPLKKGHPPKSRCLKCHEWQLDR